MIVEYRYDVRPDQRITCYNSIPMPTIESLERILRTLEFLQDRTNFAFKVIY